MSRRPDSNRGPLRASLLIASGASIVEVAAQLGHSPSMCLSTYAHVVAELEGQLDLEAEIRTARESTGDRDAARAVRS